MSYSYVRRLCTGGAVLALMGALSLALSGVASAETFHVHTGEELSADVTTANGNAQANTIVLERQRPGEAYDPFATLKLTDKTGLQTIEGPSTGKEGAEIIGGAVEPSGSELISVGEGVSVDFKNVALTQGGGGLEFPAIEVELGGNLTLERSLVGNNLNSGVVVQPGATATVVNSTIAGTVNNDTGFVNAGTSSFTNSTVAYNQGGGISNSGALTLTNTIVANNTKNGLHDCTGAGTFTVDHSLDSDGTCHVEAALSAKNPMIKEAQRYDGGPTRVLSVLPGSPVIDAADTAKCPATDQRGMKRPDVTGTACDIGADEYNEVKPVITPSSVSPGITTQATGTSGAFIKYAKPTGTSAEAEVESVTCTPASENTFAVGTTTVTCTAVDGHENKAEASFKVSVMKPEVTVATASLGGIPTGLAVNSEHDVWVAMAESNSVKEFSATGTAVLTLGALASPCTGRLEGPFGVAVDSSNNVWVVDETDDLVREFSPTGTCTLQFGGGGSGPGQLSNPRGIAIDSHGNVWVSDSGNSRIEEFSSTGAFVRQFGAGNAGFFAGLGGLSVNSHGNVWVADVGRGRVDVFNETGTFEGQVGPTTIGGCDTVMCLPMGVAVDSSGNAWVADYGHSRIDQFNESGQMLGHIGTFGSLELQFEWPLAVAVDSSAGDVWIPDIGNTRLEKWIGADPPGGAPAAAPLTLKNKNGRSKSH